VTLAHEWSLRSLVLPLCAVNDIFVNFSLDKTTKMSYAGEAKIGNFPAAVKGGTKKSCHGERLLERDDENGRSE